VRAEARVSYEKAPTLTRQEPERQFLARRLDEFGPRLSLIYTALYLSSTMFGTAVQAAPEIHPYIKFWGDFAKNVVEIVAIIVGGFWTYFLFLKGRTLKHRLESSVDAAIELRHGKPYLVVHSELKNIGSSKVRLNRDESGIAIYPGEPKGLGTAEVSSISWHKRAMFNVFSNHEWIEPTESIRDALVVELPDKPLPLYKVELIAVNQRWPTAKAQNWCTSVIVREFVASDAARTAKKSL